MNEDSVTKNVKEALEKAPPRKFTETIELAVNLRDLDMSVPRTVSTRRSSSPGDAARNR